MTLQNEHKAIIAVEGTSAKTMMFPTLNKVFASTTATE